MRAIDTPANYEEAAAKRLAKNAKKVARVVRWQQTRIGATDGARESDPFAFYANQGRGRDFAARSVKSRLRRSDGRGRSYARDAARDFLDLTTEEALARLEPLALRQRDDSAKGFWVGLKFFLTETVPAGTRISDCNPATLNALIDKLVSNVA